MSGYIDLHLHTNRSDGSMSPSELVMYAKYQGLSVIAITDHDTVSGNEEAILEGARQGLEVVPGVELSISSDQGELHLLGYFVDFLNPEFQRSLFRLREHRKRRNPLIIQRLSTLGIDLNLQEIRRKANNGNVGRPHIASAMVEAHYVSSIKEAFDLYLRKNGPAYVPKEILTAVEGIQLILKHGGIPVLAHPHTLDIKNANQLSQFIRQLTDQGLAGMEVYHPGSSRHETQKLEKIALRHSLLMTGGSDFHGLESISAEHTIVPALAQLPYELYEILERAHVYG